VGEASSNIENEKQQIKHRHIPGVSRQILFVILPHHTSSEVLMFGSKKQGPIPIGHGPHSKRNTLCIIDLRVAHVSSTSALATGLFNSLSFPLTYGPFIGPKIHVIRR
jgi:hypothetical protein